MRGMERTAINCLIDAALLSRECGGAFDVRAVAETDSTNLRLMNEPFGAAIARPRLMSADHQHAGRGRRGRNWVGDPARSLMMSCAFEREAGPDSPPMTGWPIAVGVAVAEALSPWLGDLQLKWPNDLQRAGRKCGGILIETRRQPLSARTAIERVVVGTGFNLRVDAAMRDSIDQPVAGLFDDVELPPREQVAGRIACSLLQAWQQFDRQGLTPFIDRWARFDALTGQAVLVIEGGTVLLQGVADGVDASGALRVLAPDGVHQVTVGDVSVRTAASRHRPAGG
mgnify:CR=1 FL=1